MRRDLYTITTLSNLHVGAGDINFDIIDNQVQRDATTTLPTIHSSSLKGAFREAAGEGSNYTSYIFGPDNSSNDSHQTGAFHFFEASLLAMPVRSNKKPYFLATSVGVLTSFLDFLEDFEIAFDENVKSALEALSKQTVEEGNPLIFEKLDRVILEDLEAKVSTADVSALTEFLGQDIALFADEDLKALTLPVLARNYLVNGESKNLWYEEVVPKKSKFYFVIAKPSNLDEADKKEKIDAFEKRFDTQKHVQIGANKSIGYGVCKLQKVSV
ncbi:type III-B CRISPR module RAMP protein Cmr4 [Sulfurovum sp.]|uniref:type III-B CRISPR module RAMP protein Cmr4 n=1 Tax=Sulfurovum sp. TaxID=1969726 RepID=UPI0025CE6756|nr:type III-B CRISPR module RAMP protein Cmr4 [Sulfurovum sp.]